MKKLLLSVLLLLSLSSGLRAESSKPLEDFITTELNSQQKALEEAESEKGLFFNPKWYLEIIRVRLRASAGMEVPKLTKFEVKPYIELFWTQKL